MTEPQPPVRRVLVFTIVALSLLMMSVDSTIVATALHALQHGLHTSINWAGWTLTAYSFGFVLMLPVSGKLSEQYGRRRVFLTSLLCFTGASLLCGVVNNIYLLIALRAVQAAGGAGFTPSATGIVVDYFGTARDRYVSLFGSIFPIGAMIGPIFGGLFVTYWTWRGVFLVNVPIGIAAIALTLRYVPRDPRSTHKRRERIDILGMSLLGIGLITGMLAVSSFGEHDTHPWEPSVIVPLIIAVICLWMFFHHVNRARQPFIAPRLIHGPGFGAVNLINGWFGGITLGVIALIPLYAANRYGINALDSGTLLIAEGAATVLFSVTAVFLLRRTGYRLPMYLGGGVAGLGVVLLALPPMAGISPYTWLAAASFLIGAGYGTTNPAARNAGLQLAVEHSSTLAALRSMCLQIGSIITISVATALLAAVHESGTAQAWFYLAAAVLMVLAQSVVARIPEHRGAW